MARVCSIRGSKVRVGRKIHRSGLAKKKGGIGRHVTKTVKRKVSPNLHTKRVWVPELSKYVRVKASAKALKTINKNGAYVTLKKAGLIEGAFYFLLLQKLGGNGRLFSCQPMSFRH